MSDFQMVEGFEDVWRPPARPRRRTPETILRPGTASAGQSARAKLARIVARAPEVMVKVTGRTGDPAHLRAHLDYISRNGAQELETQDGALVFGRAGVKDLAADWATEQLADRRTRASAPFSHGVVLSMPAGTDPLALRDAARAFAVEVFASGHDYAFTLHTDTPRPHVHLSICSRGHAGQRLNPRKADLELWRQVFAEKLRERGIEAEATPRRARGVTRKPERATVRRVQDRFRAGKGDMAQVRRSAYREAVKAAFQGDIEPRVWERRTSERQGVVRALYLAQARLLSGSSDPLDRQLGAKVEAFVRIMPAPDTQRLALARELRDANQAINQDRAPETRERTR